jgi:hypothetical protein
MIDVDLDDPDTVIEGLQPVAQVAPIVDQLIGLATYDAVMAVVDGAAP